MTTQISESHEHAAFDGDILPKRADASATNVDRVMPFSIVPQFIEPSIAGSAGPIKLGDAAPVSSRTDIIVCH